MSLSNGPEPQVPITNSSRGLGQISAGWNFDLWVSPVQESYTLRRQSIHDCLLNSACTYSSYLGRERNPSDVHDVVGNHDGDLIDLTIETTPGQSSVLHTTSNHPFWDDTTHRWVPAGELAIGDNLSAATNGHVRLVARQVRPGAAGMYNLTIDQLHTYYVVAGTTPVLVHNAKCANLERSSMFRIDPGGRDSARALVFSVVRVRGLDFVTGLDLGDGFRLAVGHEDGGRRREAASPAGRYSFLGQIHHSHDPDQGICHVVATVAKEVTPQQVRIIASRRPLLGPLLFGVDISKAAVTADDGGPSTGSVAVAVAGELGNFRATDQLTSSE
ncbi:polymorphic toxin-type HINT domain-containing protein [Streptomyces sp. NPDC088194]|uniref:polymorphic toxin-type HINT domain-containing protein n=1 Tax=Streptomyces sp. NPDC088194 TaxID=3154931 RepID=UPI00344BADE5